MGQAGQSPEDYNSPVSPSQLANQAQQNLDPNYVDPNDSGDPCDPNSAYYDVDYCAQQNDSGDPCDPASMYYDPASCPDDNQDAGNDSGDPCDPSSQVYDPDYCQQLQGGGDDGSSYQDQGSAAPAAPSAAPGYGGAAADASAYPQTPYQDFSPMDPPPPGANAANATAPDGGTYSTTPTPYTDASGNPTDAFGDPSDAYGNPLNSAGQPVDSAGNPLPTDANGNADPSQIDSGDPCDPNSTAYNVATCNQQAAPAAPLAPAAPQSLCDSLIMPVPAQYVTDPSSNPTGTGTGTFPVPQAVAGMIPVPQANLQYGMVINKNLYVQDPTTGTLSYIGFLDMSRHVDPSGPGGVSASQEAVRTFVNQNCPNYQAAFDKVWTMMTNGVMSQPGFDPSVLNLPGWNFQPAGTAASGQDSGDPCDVLSASFNAATCQASGQAPYSSGSSTTDSGDPCDHTSQYYNPTTCANQGSQPYAAHKTLPSSLTGAKPKKPTRTVPKASPRLTMRGWMMGAPIHVSKRKPAPAGGASTSAVPVPKPTRGVIVPKGLKGWFIRGKPVLTPAQKAAQAKNKATYSDPNALNKNMASYSDPNALNKNMASYSNPNAPIPGSSSYVNPAANLARNIATYANPNSGIINARRTYMPNLPSVNRAAGGAAIMPSQLYRNAAYGAPPQAAPVIPPKIVPKAPITLRRVSSLVSSTASAPSNRRR